MSKEFVYESPIACHIKGFIEEKKSLGYRYFTESKWMKKFDDYWIAHGYKDTGLTVGNLADWVQKRECEGTKCLVTRISVIRQFSIYLNGLGIPSYYPPIEVRYAKPLIHLLAAPEIKELFTQIDGYRPMKGSDDIRRMGNEYPVLFRLIYLNGLRISEACKLSVPDIDLDNGTVTILDGKGNKDRMVYLSDDMRRLCLTYFSYVCDKLGQTPAWFSPGWIRDPPFLPERFGECLMPAGQRPPSLVAAAGNPQFTACATPMLSRGSTSGWSRGWILTACFRTSASFWDTGTLTIRIITTTMQRKRRGSSEKRTRL